MGIGKPLYLHIMSVYVRTVFEYFCYWHVDFFAGTDTFHVVVPRMWPTPNWNSSFGALAPSLTCISCERQMENHEEWVMSPIRSMSDIFVGRKLPFFWYFGQRRMTIRWMPLANMYLSVGKCPGLGHHLQMVASENRQRWNSAVNVPEWQVLIFISWTSIFLYYSLDMLRLYVFHWLFAPAIEHSLELPCFYWVIYLSHVPHVVKPHGWFSQGDGHDATEDSGTGCFSHSAASGSRCWWKTHPGEGPRIGPWGLSGKRGHGWPWDISEMNGSW